MSEFDPDLGDVINKYIEYDRDNLNTAIPAKIVEYDRATQEAVVQPLLEIVYENGVSEPFGNISGVPVMHPSSGNSALILPVKPDDTVLLIVCQASLDEWLNQDTTETVNPQDRRRHDINDAVALLGLSPFPRAIEGSQSLTPDEDSVILKNNIGTSNEINLELKSDGSVSIIASGGVSIEGDLAVTGDISSEGEVTAGTVALTAHTHAAGTLTNSGGPVTGATGTPS